MSEEYNPLKDFKDLDEIREDILNNKPIPPTLINAADRMIKIMKSREPKKPKDCYE